MVTTQARMYQRRRTAAQWTSENPILAAGELGVESDTGLVKIGDGGAAWNSRPYINNIAQLTAGDPTEVDLDTVANVTTLTLLDPIARHYVHSSGQYYWSHYGTSASQAQTQNNLVYMQVFLTAGTLDRIGVDVATAAASNVYRLGVYNANGGMPGSKIAEAAATADASTTGIKDLTISAVIPTNGVYWFAGALQGGTGSAIQAGPAGAAVAYLPLGTTVQGGTSNFMARIENSVTGTLPATATPINNPQTIRMRWHFRYV